MRFSVYRIFFMLLSRIWRSQLKLTLALNTKARNIRRLPWEAQSSFANQLCRVRTKFNMAVDSNSRKVRAACLLSIFLTKILQKKLFYIFITFRLQSYWMKHLLKSCEDGWRLTAARSSRWKNHVKKLQPHKVELQWSRFNFPVERGNT